LLKEIANERDETLSGLVAKIDEDRQRDRDLSAAIRLFVLDCVRDQVRKESRQFAVA